MTKDTLKSIIYEFHTGKLPDLIAYRAAPEATFLVRETYLCGGAKEGREDASSLLAHKRPLQEGF
jgi:hypothetical protein